MTKEDVIRMAREAGYPYANPTTQEREILERFAALVAAAERESNLAEIETGIWVDNSIDEILCSISYAIRARNNQ